MEIRITFKEKEYDLLVSSYIFKDKNKVNSILKEFEGCYVSSLFINELNVMHYINCLDEYLLFNSNLIAMISMVIQVVESYEDKLDSLYREIDDCKEYD